jgi:hypothetical protein
MNAPTNAELIASLLAYARGLPRSGRSAHEARMAKRSAFDAPFALQRECQADHVEAIEAREPWA